MTKEEQLEGFNITALEEGEDGARNVGTPGSWKRQGNGFSPGLSEDPSSADTMMFAQQTALTPRALRLKGCIV